MDTCKCIRMLMDLSYFLKIQYLFYLKSRRLPAFFYICILSRSATWVNTGTKQWPEIIPDFYYQKLLQAKALVFTLPIYYFPFRCTSWSGKMAAVICSIVLRTGAKKLKLQILIKYIRAWLILWGVIL